MEAHGRLVSFEGWSADEPKAALAEALEKAVSWDELRRSFARFDLDLRQHGAGLAVATRQGRAAAKASALGRQFFRASLERRFGPYEPPSEDVRQLQPETGYPGRTAAHRREGGRRALVDEALNMLKARSRRKPLPAC